MREREGGLENGQHTDNQQLCKHQQNAQGDMIVDYISPATASFLAYFFVANPAFTFGEPFRTPGTIVGGPAFVASLQSRILINLLAQVGPEVVCDYVCVLVERYWGFGELVDEYWDKVTSLRGMFVYFPTFFLITLANFAVVLCTGKTFCAEGQCLLDA